MPTLGTLAAGVRPVSAVRRSEVYITELGADDLPIVAGAGAGERATVAQYRRFQYYPESVADSKQVGYQPKEVPGGSLPLYQWTTSGERTISFTAFLTTDIDHLVMQQTVETDQPTGARQGDQTPPPGVEIRTTSISGSVNRVSERLRAAGALQRNPYIPAAIAWLRRFMLPRYGENVEVGVPLTQPPHKLLLHLTGTQIERGGGVGGFSVPGGGILCVMTTCDVNYEKFFPSGNPRKVSVDLAFAEVPQRGGAVRFPSASGLDEDVAFYRLEARAPSNTSGGSR